MAVEKLHLAMDLKVRGLGCASLRVVISGSFPFAAQVSAGRAELDWYLNGP